MLVYSCEVVCHSASSLLDKKTCDVENRHCAPLIFLLVRCYCASYYLCDYSRRNSSMWRSELVYWWRAHKRKKKSKAFSHVRVSRRTRCLLHPSPNSYWNYLQYILSNPLFMLMLFHHQVINFQVYQWLEELTRLFLCTSNERYPEEESFKFKPGTEQNRGRYFFFFYSMWKSSHLHLPI